MATCPECDADVDVDEFDVDKGDSVSCAECGSNLQVASIAPFELEPADDDDDDDDEDDDEKEVVEGEEDVDALEDDDEKDGEDWDE